MQRLLDGALGYIWPWEPGGVDIGGVEPKAGFVERRDGAVDVKLLVDDVRAAFDGINKAETVPEALLGAADGVGLVVLDLVGQPGASIRFGGSMASTKTYRAKTLIATSAALDTSRPSLSEAAIHLHGDKLFRWANTSAHEWSSRVNPETRLVESATLELKSGDPDVAVVPGIGELSVGTSWRGGDADQGLSVDLALEIGVRPPRPRRSHIVLGALGDLQVLLSALFNGFVVAGGAWARLPGSDTKGLLWNSVLMPDVARAPVTPPRKGFMPLVDLPDLGGAAGLGRWLRLAREHPRAMAPIANRWRRGQGTPELQLFQCAVALEYWVASHRRTTQWAHTTNLRPLAAARRVGHHFDNFVGDDHAWADRLWKNYNDLKHNPEASVDEYEVALLAQSAYLLILGLLLDRVARTKRPSRRIFTGHQFEQLGSLIREHLRA